MLHSIIGTLVARVHVSRPVRVRSPAGRVRLRDARVTTNGTLAQHTSARMVGNHPTGSGQALKAQRPPGPPSLWS